MTTMKATVSWRKDMFFIGRPPSGHEVPMDAPATVGGGDTAARPMELLLLGLGGCTGMDVVSVLGKMRRKVDFLDIELEAEQSEAHPRELRRVTITYRICGPGLDEESVQRAVDLSQEKYCSVAATLRIPVKVSWEVKLAGTGLDQATAY